MSYLKQFLLHAGLFAAVTCVAFLRASEVLFASEIAASGVAASGIAQQSGQEVSAGWQAREPGFSVQTLLGRGPAMWAAGNAESIAVSTDAGRHWQFKHHDAKGSLLLVLNFVDARFGYAAGTGGRVLFTEDGGETWTVHNIAEDTIVQAAFGDERHGIIRTLAALTATFNGGKSWNPIVPESDPDWLSKFPFTVDMAALDQDHLAVRISAGASRDGEYLWTANGGWSWDANYIGNSVISTLFAADGNYWSVGHSVLSHQANRRDKFGAGYSAPMTFHSRNGIVWEHNPLSWEACHWHDCQGCNAGGCFAGKTSFLEFREDRDGMAAARMFKFPAHEDLSSQWAKTGNELCLLARSTVQCADLQPVADLDTHDDSPTWLDRSIIAIGKYRVSYPQCIHCPLDSIYVTHDGESGSLNLQFSLELEPTGLVSHAEILGGIPEDLRPKLKSQLETWLFEPFLKDGVPSPTSLSLPDHIKILNPARPTDPSFVRLVPDPEKRSP